MSQQGEPTILHHPPLDQVEFVSPLEEAIVHLLDVAVVPDGTMQRYECKLCGGIDDEHCEACPVPALEELINPTELD